MPTNQVSPKDYIIGIIIFTFVVVGGISLLGILDTGTNGKISQDPRYSDFNQTFNVYDNVTNQVGNIRDNIVNADTDFGVFGVLNSLIATSWQGVKLLFSSFGFMDAVFGGLSTVFGLPAWVGGLLILLVIVIIAFAIWAAIFQTQW